MNRPAISTEPLSFDAMGLRVGQSLQLIRHSPTPYKCYTTLVGYVDREFMIVRLPREPGGAIRFEQGQMLEVRLFSGISIYAFDSAIESLLMHPRDYMLMTYPSDIRAQRLRDHQRVSVQMPIEIKASGAAGSEPAGFMIMDLSGSGALIVGPELLGAVGSRWLVTLRFELVTTGQAEEVSVVVTIQNTSAQVDKAVADRVMHHHGVKFDTIDPRIALLVHEIQNKIKTLA